MCTISGAIEAGHRAAVQALDDLRPQALSSREYLLLKAIESGNQQETEFEDEEEAKKIRIFRWTFFLPVFALTMGYFVFRLREKYANILIPFHG